MTQEEKAKAYDKALATAKRVISNNYSKVEKLCLECIFPELKESEDERIRKWLLECVENLSNGNFIEVSKQDVLSYLEKQKEQEEIPLMNGNADLYFDNWIQHNDTTKRGCFEEGIRYAERLQKEQKLEVKDPFDDEQFRRGYESGYADAKREQKPAEWSEEDERILKGIIGLIDHDQHYGVSNNEMISWLKSLSLNLKKKNEDVAKLCSNKWSKQDEAMIKSILFVLESYVSQSESASSPSLITTYPTYYKEIDWLKSLRRSWKPSEEQMSMLLAVINEPNNAGSESCHIALKSLYNDLMKRM